MKLKSYKEDLLGQLKDPEFAAAYLAQVLESGDKNAFLVALRDVVEAGGGISAVAQHAHIQRQSLYKALSKNGNPTLDTLQNILRPLGLRISVSPNSVAQPACSFQMKVAGAIRRRKMPPAILSGE